MNSAVSETEIFSHQSEDIGTTGCSVKKMGWLYNANKTVMQNIDFSREEYIITGQFFSASIRCSLFSNTTDLFLSPVSLKFSTWRLYLVASICYLLYHLPMYYSARKYNSSFEKLAQVHNFWDIQCFLLQGFSTSPPAILRKVDSLR